MARFQLQYSKRQIDTAADWIVKSEPGNYSPEYGRLVSENLEVMAQWRAAHEFSLGQFHVLLRRNADCVQANATVAKRLKRLRSVSQKLRRPGAGRLTQLQDIGGCRAIMDDSYKVAELVRRLEASRTKHKIVKRDDRIANPAETGYRSAHLIWRYSDDHPDAKGFLCEMQIRSKAQHAWAAAVELAGFVRGEDLKAGQGDKDWLRLFALASSGIAYREGCPRVPGTPEKYADLQRELRELSARLDAATWFSGFRSGIKERASKPDTFWYVLRLNSAEQTYGRWEFKLTEIIEAHQLFTAMEIETRDQKDTHVVLVAAEDLHGVRETYPAFFDDTDEFVNQTATMLGFYG